MRVDTELIEIAQRRYHLIDRSDVAAVMTSKQWCRRVDDGEWKEIAPFVWCHRVTAVDWRLQARAGLRSLGREAVLYGRTSAGWWEVGEMEVVEVEFMVPRARKSRSFPFVVHTTQHFELRDMLVRDGVRLTSATRTVIDLAIAGNTAGDIEKVIDDAMHRRLTSLPTLRNRIDVLCGRGVKGSAFLKALLLDTGGESYLERKFLGLVRHANLPRPLCQVVHRAEGKHIARVDFQFPGTNVVAEVSGRLGHVSDRDRQRDGHRRNALQASGHIVLEFSTADVLDGQAYVVTTLTRELAKAAAR